MFESELNACACLNEGAQTRLHAPQCIRAHLYRYTQSAFDGEIYGWISVNLVPVPKVNKRTWLCFCFRRHWGYFAESRDSLVFTSS